jgi:superfamily II DNA/RNA helicase
VNLVPARPTRRPIESAIFPLDRLESLERRCNLFRAYSILGPRRSPPAVGRARADGDHEPLPDPAATLPDCLAGRDVCGNAPTGAGKTLAFGLAVLSRLAVKPGARPRARRRPSSLVLVPTRELAAQIEAVIAPLAAAIGVRVTSIYGGVGYAKQLSVLQNGVDVLIACPGRLTDLIERGSVDLSQVDVVVLDEADRMADMGFLPAVRRLIDKTSVSRQTLLFSATLDGPVDKLIQDYQHDPVRRDVEPTAVDQGEIAHHFWRVDAQERIAVTVDAIKAGRPAVVFCRTKRRADRLSDRLARSRLASAAIHGNRSQSQRERALAAFRAGRTAQRSRRHRPCGAGDPHRRGAPRGPITTRLPTPPTMFTARAGPDGLGSTAP